MRDHELELIAALAEGRLDDEAEARALMDSSSELRQEYEAQKTALDALSTASRAQLSDTERSALHRDLWTELRSPAPANNTPWYYRWAPVAAGMLVVVGLVAVINQPGPSTGVTPEAAQFVVSTTAAGTSAEPTEEAADSGADGGADGESAPTSGGSELPSDDLDRSLGPPSAAFYDAEADRIRQTAADGIGLQSFDGEATQDQLQDCVDRAIPGFEMVAAYPAPVAPGVDGDVPEDSVPYIVAIPTNIDLEAAPIAFVDSSTCEVITVDE